MFQEGLVDTTQLHGVSLHTGCQAVKHAWRRNKMQPVILSKHFQLHVNTIRECVVDKTA